MIYFTADLHLGHENIIHHCSRPFRTVEEMDRALIDAWNKRVGPEDTVYILGDLMFSCKDPAGYLRQLAGKKHLILGNHDAVWMKRLKKTEPDLPEAAFESIQQAAEITVDNCRVTLSHYPMMTWNGFAEGTYLIYGHIHNGTEATYWPLLSTMGHALNAGGGCQQLPACDAGGAEGQQRRLPPRPSGEEAGLGGRVFRPGCPAARSVHSQQ